ncbi:DMT family transporter [Sporomusa malonica]|uniref:Transporter family-2 protein n=1 Tax=Sporomusa malonica TaxID=112901 RepID=A0A1W2DNX6_9FIRM|nr:DMT family transporter [Sporomusa malonica]SMC99170.1 transporter family-2 protein [Sporomusa malonica]
MIVISGLMIGVLTAIMVSLNGILSTYLEMYNSVLIVHVAGLMTVIITLLIVREAVNKGSSAPLYLYCVGIFGVLMVVLTNICFQSIGVALTVATGLLGQSVLSALIDHNGWLGMPQHRFTARKIPGLVLILTGTAIMIVY